MRISEMIALLQQIQEVAGDLPIYTSTDEGGAEEVDDVQFCKGGRYSWDEKPDHLSISGYAEGVGIHIHDAMSAIPEWKEWLNKVVAGKVTINYYRWRQRGRMEE